MQLAAPVKVQPIRRFAAVLLNLPAYHGRQTCMNQLMREVQDVLVPGPSLLVLTLFSPVSARRCR